MSVLSRFWKQSFFLPKPPLTEANLPDQKDRVIIVTGGYTGVGLELAKILYSRNAIVYIAGRSQSKADTAIAAIQTAAPKSTGKVAFLHLDLADLTTIKASAQTFQAQETRLDVLINNAGVMIPPSGSKSAQGHELQIATNCLGPFLFTQLLLPLLQRTAATAPAGSVRVSWAGSLAVELQSPSPGGVKLDKDGAYVSSSSQTTNYGASKAGNVLLATEFARRGTSSTSEAGVVIHNAFNPGNLSTELQRHANFFFHLMVTWMLYPAVYGGYTELFAGFSEAAGKEDKNGAYVVPWGRFADNRKDIEAVKHKEGGTAEKFWEWCEKETKTYM